MKLLKLKIRKPELVSIPESERTFFIQLTHPSSTPAFLKSMKEDCQMEAENSLEELKKYFGRGDILSSIRNRFAFHYDSAKEIKKEVDEAPDSFLKFLSPRVVATLFIIFHMF